MQGRPLGPQGPPGKAPSDKPQPDLRTPEADPGVPPKLAKLGIRSADWEKIQATRKSDVGPVPDEYRELMKGYFESISQKFTTD